MEPVITIPALGDNFIYLYPYHGDCAFVVDPGDAGPVFKSLEKYKLNLTHALATHHHFDHTAGIESLKKKTGCTVPGQKPEILHLDELFIKIIAAPGHTRDSVCYYLAPSQQHSGLLFTGDTLFIGGCGRPMECAPSILWDSLQKIAALPDDTLVYPGHDYTGENYEFALTIEPDNKLVQKCLQQIIGNKKTACSACSELVEVSGHSESNWIPSTIGHEKETNIFLRCGDPKIKKLLNMPAASDAETFAELRRRKNIFG